MSERIVIKEICEVYDGPHATPKKTVDGPVYLGIDAITDDGKINAKEFAHLSEEDYIKWTKRVTPQYGDIVFSYEATLGRYALIPKDFYGCLGRRLAIIRNVSKDIDTLWLYYYFLSPEWKQFIQSKIIKGSTVNRISVEDFPTYTVPNISIKVQCKIANILSKIDEKIALNNNINDNLEQQAKLLYDYWFTQFDFPNENGQPYRSSGGKMVWNEQLKRTIPDSWTTNPLSDIFTYKSGYSFSSDLYEVSGKYKLLTIKNIQNNGINLNVDNYINILPDNVPDYCLLKAKDILMSLTGNVGRVGIMYTDNCLLNQRVALAEPVNINQRVFVYFLLKSDIIHKQYKMIANGSSQQNLSPIEAEKVIIAYNPEVVTKFSTLCNEYLNTIVSNLAENQELVKLRDWLLPMLLNGQATISD